MYTSRDIKFGLQPGYVMCHSKVISLRHTSARDICRAAFLEVGHAGIPCLFVLFRAAFEDGGLAACLPCESEERTLGNEQVGEMQSEAARDSTRQHRHWVDDKMKLVSG